jgi:SOS response regulatory protein OraA/RecX
VDDARFAANRAAALAERGYGDAAIRADLERKGVPAEVVEDAVGALEAELERAARIVERRGPGARTARYLAGKGFGEETVEAASGGAFAPDP